MTIEPALHFARVKYIGGEFASDVTAAQSIMQQKQFAWLQTACNLLPAELNIRQARVKMK